MSRTVDPDYRPAITGADHDHFERPGGGAFDPQTLAASGIITVTRIDPR
jgi:hypothetical protein